MNKQLFELIRKELLSGVKAERAKVLTENLNDICQLCFISNPRLAMEAAKYILWFGDDKAKASYVLRKIAKINWRERPAIALKASIYLVDLGCNTQEVIDENAIILKLIAEEYQQKRPQLAFNAALRVVNDCEQNDTVEDAAFVLQKLARYFFKSKPAQAQMAAS